MKRKITIGIIIILLLLIVLVTLLLIPIVKNNNFNKKIISDIYANTEIKNITYTSKSNNYYVVKVDNKVLVLDLNYEVVYTKESVRDTSMPLVYTRNNLYYVEKIRNKNKITYNYYSTDEDILVFSSVIGGN